MVPIADAVIHTPLDNVCLVPSSRNVQNLDAAIGLEVDGQLRLADALVPVVDSRAYDIILLDCPPSLGIPTRNALAAAHFVVIPLEADKFSADGVAYMHHLQTSFRAFATEGGHIDFAPKDEIQEELLDYLEKKYDRVSYERILSGPGLVDLYGFCTEEAQHDVTAGWVNLQAMQGGDLGAVTAMRLYATIFGSFVGNIALMFRPSGGIYMVGGVTVKTAYWLQSEFFHEAYLDKGRMSSLAMQTPVYLVMDEHTGLKGIIEFARTQAMQQNAGLASN